MSSDLKNLRLSLERPYKDDSGEPIPIVEDILEDGTYTYEPKQTADERLKSHLERIFIERGSDFFLNPDKRTTQEKELEKDSTEDAEHSGSPEGDANAKPMTYQELMAMREELVPVLHTALHEALWARDLLEKLLPGNQNASADAPAAGLTATITHPEPQSIPLQTFDTQVAIGSKDEALRKAANLFNTASTTMETTHRRSEQYWINALKIRRHNWRIIPAPLPFGTLQGKGADRIARDFLVLYGLEESSPAFRKRGIAWLSDLNDECKVTFPQRQKTRMKIMLTYREPDGTKRIYANSHPSNPEDGSSPDATLCEAQQELVDEEIFVSIMKEAPDLSTALARVSERLVVVDVSQGVELKFELIKDDAPAAESSPICDLIYHTLHALLSKRHSYHKTERLNASGNFPSATPIDYSPPMLQPILDFLQYHVFCERLRLELTRAVDGLKAVGFSASVSFDAVGETGEELVRIVAEPRPRMPGGEAMLKIDDREILRLTFTAPSALAAYLTQTTLSVYSIPQLEQLLKTEIERFILQRIRLLGERLKGGTWLIDLDHLVARWDTIIFTFLISFSKTMKINCSAFRVDSKTGLRANHQYSEQNDVPLLTWVEDIVQRCS